MHDLIKTRVPNDHCLNCRTLLTGAAGERAPMPDDLTCCIECGAVMVYNRELKLRGFTDQERDDLLADRELMSALAEKVHTVHIFQSQKQASNN